MSTLTKTLLALIGPLFLLSTAQAEAVRLAGAPTTSLPLLDAVKIFKTEKQIDMLISTQGGTSSSGVVALGSSLVDVAMVSRLVTAEERADFPQMVFTEFYFGEQTAVMVVSRDVWESGVHMLTRSQAREIYEGRIRNWKELGGENREIVGYTANWGYGVREAFMDWIYDDVNKVRPNRFALVSSNEEAKACIETTPGSIAQVSMPIADGKTLFALKIQGDDGKVIDPTVAAVAEHSYPMSKPLILVVNNRPLGKIKTLVEFMLGPRGQELVRQHNYLTLPELGVKPEPLE